MQLKISTTNKENFDHYLESILNMAMVIASAGYIPDQLDMATPQARGRYWYRDHNTYRLYPITNDFWVNVTEENHTETEHLIVLYFHYRYDRSGPSLAEAMTQLIAMRCKTDAVTLIP